MAWELSVSKELYKVVGEYVEILKKDGDISNRKLKEMLLVDSHCKGILVDSLAREIRRRYEQK